MRSKQRKPEQVLNVKEGRNEEIFHVPETVSKGRKRKRSPTPSLTDVIVQSTDNSKRTTRSSMKQTIAILESEISCNDTAAAIENPQPEPSSPQTGIKVGNGTTKNVKLAGDAVIPSKKRKRMAKVQKDDIAEPTSELLPLQEEQAKAKEPPKPAPSPVVVVKTKRGRRKKEPVHEGESTIEVDSVKKDETVPIMEPTPTISTLPNLELIDEKPTYAKGDKVLCHFQNMLYDAIIMEIHALSDYRKMENCNIEATFRSKPRDNNYESGSTADDFGYFIHYCHWKSEWDEWVRSDCFVPITEESRNQQREMKKLVAKNKQKKSGTTKKRRKSTRREDEEQAVQSALSANDRDGEVADLGDLETFNQLPSENAEIELDLQPSGIESEGGQIDLQQNSPMVENVGLISFKENPEVKEQQPGIESEGGQIDLQQNFPMVENVGLISLKENPKARQVLFQQQPGIENLGGQIELQQNSPMIENVDLIGSKENPKAKGIVGPIREPTISEAVKDLEESMLGTYSDKLTVQAFTMKLQMLYDYFCHGLIPDNFKQHAVQAMADQGKKNYSDVVHCSGLFIFLEWIENGKSEDWELDHRKETLTDELNEIRQIFDLFKDQFVETRRYFSMTAKYNNIGGINLLHLKQEPA